jgi:hypothetical protein
MTRIPSLLGLSLVAAQLLSPIVVAEDALAAQVQDRIPPRPIKPAADFDRAVAAGTRSADGGPGEGYWQQRVDYVIRAAVDAARRITGSEDITYHNQSPDALPTLLLRLEQNVFREGARRNRRVPITGGFHITRVEVNGTAAAHRHPGAGYYQALTLLEVTLPTPLAPGDSTQLSLDWSHQIPPAPTFRNGNLDDEVFAVAQWYPRLAVYDDVYGWDQTPYLGDGEFYLEYGSFDVELTVPAGWLVGATGTLENPADVIGAEGAARLAAAAQSDTTVRIAEAAPSAGNRGTATWRFTAEDVRDFAFAISSVYVWDAVGAGDGILAQALYRPHLDAWSEAARYTAHTIRTFSEALGPYAYPQLTMTEGPVGGMEYPMLVLNPSTNNARSLASVTIHEGGHQWFPMMVGNMEAKHAWMDEGFTTYWQQHSIADLWGEEPAPWGALSSYLVTAGTEEEVPLMRHTDLVSPYGARTLAAYRKPAVALGALRSVLGDEVFEAAFRDFFATWMFKHPQPWDFFATFERHAGQDLDWFWRPLFFETDVMDHAIGSMSTDGSRTVVEVVDLGDVVLPARVAVTLDEGGVQVVEVPASRWLDEGRTVRLTVDGTAVRVELDPALAFPDVDRSNNTWER